MVPVADLLTEREKQVLHLLSHGNENREIGRRLSTTEDTVKTHTRNIFRKLRATGRAHAVRRGFEMGLLLPYTDPNGVKLSPPPAPPETALAAAMRVANPERQLFAALQSLGWTPPRGGTRG